MHNSEFSFAIKHIFETIENINKIYTIDNNILKLLISWFSQLYCDYMLSISPAAWIMRGMIMRGW